MYIKIQTDVNIFLSCFEQEKRRHLERKYFEVSILNMDDW